MPKKAKDAPETKIEKNLQYIGLNLAKIPKFLMEFEEFSYSFQGSNKEEDMYKVYRNIPIQDIQILITDTERLEETSKKYAKAAPLPDYLDSKHKENAAKHQLFLQMVENLETSKVEELDKEQKKFKKQQPFLVKYKNNYKWQIFYSEKSKKYFMLVPAKEQDNSAFFYVLKKQIEGKKEKKSETIYAPISYLEPSKEFFNKTQLSELENRLYMLTKEWPSIYEVQNIEDGKTRVEIIGTTYVFEQIKSSYKITIRSKKEAVELEHWLYILFILTRDLKEDYTFITNIDKNGALEVYHHNQKITFDILPNFIEDQIEYNLEDIDAISKSNQQLAKELAKKKIEAEEKSEEYQEKQKQIFNFLECRKSFFGKVKYFFKGKGSKKKIRKLDKTEKQEIHTPTEETEEAITGKSLEDLIQVCKRLSKKRTEHKNLQLDIHGINAKIESLDRRIKNADSYLSEIESHKRSIIEFFRYTNKDEAKAISEAEKQEEKSNSKVKKYFDIETDLEELGKNIDILQRKKLSSQECDVLYLAQAINQSINIANKKRIVKQEKAIMEEQLAEQKKVAKKQEWEEGGLIKNVRHREQPRKVANILNINAQTTYEEYKNQLKEKQNLLQEAFHKIQAPYELPIYKVVEKETTLETYPLFNLHPNQEIQKLDTGKKILYKIQLKEKQEALFYSNIIYYHNDNKTLPEGMDLSTEVLVNLAKYELVELRESEFSMLASNKENPTVETIQVIECEIMPKSPQEN